MIGELERFDLLEWQRQQDAKRAAGVEAPDIGFDMPHWTFPDRNPLEQGNELTNLWQQYQVPILVGVGTLVAIAMFSGKRR